MNILSVEFLRYIADNLNPTFTQTIQLTELLNSEIYLSQSVDGIERDTPFLDIAVTELVTNISRIVERRKHSRTERIKNIFRTGLSNLPLESDVSVIYESAPPTYVDKIRLNQLRLFDHLHNLNSLDIDILIEQDVDIDLLLLFMQTHTKLSSIVTTFAYQNYEHAMLPDYSAFTAKLFKIAEQYKGDWYCKTIVRSLPGTVEQFDFYLTGDSAIYQNIGDYAYLQLRNSRYIFTGADKYQISNLFNTSLLPDFSELQSVYFDKYISFGPSSKEYPIGDIVRIGPRTINMSYLSAELHALSTSKLNGRMYIVPFNVNDVERLLNERYFEKIGVLVDSDIVDRKVANLQSMYPTTEIVKFVPM